MQKLVKAFIVDDNLEAIEVLRRLLEENYSVSVVGTAHTAETAADRIISTEPDIIFLDVELPTMSGLEFCSLIHNEVKPETKVVFYTGHDKYMIEAIRRQAFDFLLKPATEKELNQIMTRYYEDKLSAIPVTAAQHKSHLPIILVVNTLNEHLTLRINDVGFFRYNPDRKLWEIVCTDRQTYVLRHRTTADVIMNYSADFVQINKRYIVNVEHIHKILDSTCILCEEQDDPHELRISKNYRRSFQDAFYAL